MRPRRNHIDAPEEVHVEQRPKGARQFFALQPHAPTHSVSESDKKAVVWFRYHFDDVPIHSRPPVKAVAQYSTAAPFHGRAANPPSTPLYVSSPVLGKGSKRAVATPLREPLKCRCRLLPQIRRIGREMRRRVIVEKHPYQDPIEPADCRHFARLILPPGRIIPQE